MTSDPQNQIYRSSNQEYYYTMNDRMDTLITLFELFRIPYMDQDFMDLHNGYTLEELGNLCRARP